MELFSLTQFQMVSQNFVPFFHRFITSDKYYPSVQAYVQVSLCNGPKIPLEVRPEEAFFLNFRLKQDYNNLINRL